ncbi:MAG: DUF502 domain-containing protein [Pseudomonadota bacterium]
MANGKSRTTRARARRRSLITKLRNNFLTGLIVVAPVAITIYLTWTIITLVDATVVPLLPSVYNPRTYFDTDIPGFGLLIFLLFTTIVGYFTKNLFGRQLIKIGESWLENVPIIRSIYNALKQIVETILNQSNSSFSSACLVEYPRKGIWAVAFVSTDTKGEIAKKVGNGGMTSVFLPTTPNPTSGFLLFVPNEDVIILDMSVEEAAKLVISAGLVTPPTKEELEAAARKAQVRRPALAGAANGNGGGGR